jgi:TPR repeat protein
MYSSFGRGVPQDDAKAVFWYRKAAELGHAGAANNLSVFYEKGLGVPPRATLKQPSGIARLLNKATNQQKLP